MGLFFGEDGRCDGVAGRGFESWEADFEVAVFAQHALGFCETSAEGFDAGWGEVAGFLSVDAVRGCFCATLGGGEGGNGGTLYIRFVEAYVGCPVASYCAPNRFCALDCFVDRLYGTLRG